MACVNLVPQVTSLYWWDGKIQQDAEVLLIAKTTQARVDELVEVVPRLHPYEVPELLVLPVEAGWPAYLQWLADSTGLPPTDEG